MPGVLQDFRSLLQCLRSMVIWSLGYAGGLKGYAARQCSRNETSTPWSASSALAANVHTPYIVLLTMHKGDKKKEKRNKKKKKNIKGIFTTTRIRWGPNHPNPNWSSSSVCMAYRMRSRSLCRLQLLPFLTVSVVLAGRRWALWPLNARRWGRRGEAAVSWQQAPSFT